MWGISQNKPTSLFAALLAGILFTFAFSPGQQFWLAIICPAALYALMLRKKPPEAFCLGFLFGLGFFGVGVSWVFISIYVFGGTPIWIAFLLSIGFVLVLSLFFALLGFVQQRYFFDISPVMKALIVYPAFWVLFEVLRGYLFTGFPWLLLGHVIPGTPFSGLGPIFGAYGSSFWLVFFSGLVVLAATPQKHMSHYQWRSSNYALFGIIVLSFVIYFLNGIQWTHPKIDPIKVSLVQGNIPQELRWSRSEITRILNTYELLTQSHYNHDLIVWPEAAIPIVPQEASHFLKKIDLALHKHQAGLITGIPYRDQNKNYYNAVIGLGSAGGLYQKRHLVPFGEYVPWAHLLRGMIQFFDLPMSDFLPGPMRQPLMTLQGVPIGVYLCYEIAYGSIILHDLPEAQLLMTLSDDAWFGHSFAPWQHVQIAQFAALETGRPLLFVSNTGVTAIIDAKGQIKSQLPQFTANVLNGVVHGYVGTTPWIRLGGDSLWIILMGILLLAVRFLSKPM